MQALLSKQQVSRRKSSSYKGIIIPFDRKPREKNWAKTRSHALNLSPNLVLGALLLLVFSVLIVSIIHTGILSKRNSSFSITLPSNDNFDAVLFKTIVPESSTNYNSTTKLSSKVIKSLKIVNYRVRTGDSLSKIANKFGLNLGTIISFNDIKDARLLKVGKLLKIPNQNGLKYIVHRGDSLSGIAKRFGVKLDELVDWNDLKSSIIHPGEELFIVGAKMRTNELNRVLGKLFIYPTRGRITSRFGMRHDPFTGILRFHNGVDIANRIGTKIVASMAGIVARTGINPTYGRYVIIRHDDGFQTLYAHLSRILVKRGKYVKQNQIIGRMGNTGYSTGSHLHFSIFKNGKPVDPLKYLH